MTAAAAAAAVAAAARTTGAYTRVRDRDGRASRRRVVGDVGEVPWRYDDLHVRAVSLEGPPRKACAHLGLVAAGRDVLPGGAAGGSAPYAHGDHL